MAKVAFLGTGLLGSAMVEGMLRRGDAVTVWNRTASKAQALESFGAKAASSPSEAVAGAARVHMTLSDDASVDGLIAQFAPAATDAPHVLTCEKSAGLLPVMLMLSANGPVPTLFKVTLCWALVVPTF